MTREQWDRVWALCEKAFSVPPAELDAFLKASKEDPHIIREAALVIASREAGLSNASQEEKEPLWPQTGKKLGRFEVLEPIGRGGNGEVYKGRDTLLGRTVALKFIAQDLASNEATARRFIREAQSASALNHPNIVTVYEVVSMDGQYAIAMEFIDGVPLSKFRGTPMPVEQVTAYGLQMAKALEAAHAAGIVHRDLKPDNVMLRSDGYIKVLDFGLARPFSLKPDNLSSTVGLPVGTIGYMSPEQYRGERATPASDVFALGITLHEMCTGKHPFHADTPLDVAHNIVWEKPRTASGTHPTVPAALSELIQKMLAKAPADRCTTAEVVQQLTARTAPARKPVTSRRWLYVAAFTFVLAVGAAAWRWLSKPSTLTDLQLRSTPLTSQNGFETSPAISPDGTAVAFAWAADVDTPTEIWIKRQSQISAVRLVDTPNAYVGSPAWSADGRRIYFKMSTPKHEGGIWSVSSDGGPPEKVGSLITSDISSALDCSPDGRWLAYSDKPASSSPMALMLLNLKTGERKQLSTPPAGYWGDWDPKFSPDGRTFVFKRVHGFWQDDLYTLPVEGGTPRRLTFDGQGIWGHAWLRDGKSVIASYQRGGTKFGLWRIMLEPGSQPVLVNEGATDLVAPATARQSDAVAWVSKISDSNIYRVSSNGGSQPVKLITSTREDLFAEWSRDGRIAFASDRDGSHEVWLAQKDGSGQVPVTKFRRGPLSSPRWSPDGRKILLNADAESRIMILDCEPPLLFCGPPKIIARVMATEFEPTWSGDGKSIYFSDTAQVWKEPVEGGQPVQLTRHGGLAQHESPDGRWLYYAKQFSGVWRTRLPVPESAAAFTEENVLDLVEQVPMYNVGENEIFFFKSKVASEAAGIFALHLTTHKIRRVVNTTAVRSISISADQQYVLYSQLDYSGSNVLVANVGRNPQ